MIITRTPLRISFFGGGTDYPTWFKKNQGAVIATSIDKYIYISCRYLPPFFEHKSRVVWSLIETVKDISEIKHPSVRASLEFIKIDKGVEIHYDADLPARTGLGSSSTFTVGLLHSLHALKGEIISKEQLAKEAIYVEQTLLKEPVGCQDQICATFGGFNLIEFELDGGFRVQPLTLPKERIDMLQQHLMLFFTGFSRTASDITSSLVGNIEKREKENELKQMYQMVYEAINILNSKNDLRDFGKLLHESWKLKRSLSSKISTQFIDEIYETAYSSGALGGKVLGAGGGGFILFFVEPHLQKKVKESLKNLLCVPINFESSGSQVIFYHPEVMYE
ncbi:MAG: kinase [Endomicrobia bacterium]|nr:kinase [Endomicrobiia bacterium]